MLGVALSAMVLFLTERGGGGGRENLHKHKLFCLGAVKYTTVSVKRVCVCVCVCVCE